MTAAGRLDEIAHAFLEQGEFRPEEIHLDEETIGRLVRLAGNPKRFLPKMFEGDWAVRGVRPKVGLARVLRVVLDNEENARVILRQGPGLFIYTFVPSE